MNPQIIKIKIGEAGAQFLQRNHLPKKGHIEKQSAGLHFYEQNWNIKTPGTVIIEQGVRSFEIPYSLSVVGTEDVEHAHTGLSEINIKAGITAADTLPHDEARREFISMLQNLLTLGWKPVIFYEEPRLTGEQAYKYYRDDNNFYGFPVNYNPTLEEWMNISTAHWYLYADNVFLAITFYRDSLHMNPTELGAYLFSFQLSSKEEKAKAQFEGEDREHWQDLWVDKIKSLKKERYAKEKELLKRGFTLYSGYEEPKIHAADPVEP